MTKVHIRTYGCSLNQSDSEVMAGLLKEAGFEIAESVKEAEAVIINTCTVKAPTEKKFFKYLEKLQKVKRHIIVTGCLPQTTPEKVAGFTLLGPTHINHIVEAVEETLNDNQLVRLVPEQNPRLNLPKIRRNQTVEVIPISAGCLGDCSYCIVKKARGSLLSYDMDAIMEQALRAIKDGVREIWLTAQDTGCYGKDIGLTLPALVKEALTLPGRFTLRIGMMNPQFVIEHFDELMNLFNSRKLFRFLHIPVQSGNDTILKRMRRRYSVEQFENVIKQIRAKYPDMSIATAVICGFPTETDEMFKETVALIKRVKPDILNISRYWDRDHTDSAVMDGKIHPNMTKERSREICSAFDWISYEVNKFWRGWEGVILIDDKGKEGTSIGRNLSYKQVIVKGTYELGSFIRVRVKGIQKHYLIAEARGYAHSFSV